MLRKCCFAFTLAFALSACQHPELLVEGPGQTFDKADIEAYTTNQNAVVEEIAKLAGMPGPPTTGDGPGWRRFVTAGIQYSDQRCEAYMSALFWFHRAKERSQEQINLVRTALVGVLGLLEATTKAITITDTVFGLSDSTLKNVGNGLLYDMDPSAVRALVEKLQAEYRQGLPAGGYNDRGAAFWAIHDYAQICLPPSIETQVAQAVAEAKAKRTDGDPVRGTPPVVQIAPLAELRYDYNDASKAIRALWKPDGKTVNKANEAKILDAMKRNGAASISIPELLRGKEYATVRAIVAHDLKIQ